MALEFTLDIDKVIATAIFIASKNLPELTPGKLLKLMFLADKYHLVRYGRPITGDHYDAMKDGPVPSFAYDMLKKEILRKPYTEQGRRLADSLSINKTNKNPLLAARRSYDKEQLSKSDILALETTLQEFGSKTFSELRDITHHMAAWERAWNSKSILRQSARMKFEDFFIDDPNAIAADVDKMIENNHLRHVLAKP